MAKKLTGVMVLAALLLTGCSASTSGVPKPHPTYTAASPTTDSAAATEAGNAASAIAVETMNAFIDHDRDQEVWWSDFSKHLSPEALFIWEGIRADRVTASAITGDPIVSVTDDTFVSVLIPTDEGSYRLDMTKRVEPGAAGGDWQVFEMTAPGEDS